MATTTNNANDDDVTFSLRRFQEALDVVRDTAVQRQYKRTPLIANWKDVGDLEELTGQCDLYLKLESMQLTGECVYMQLALCRVAADWSWTNNGAGRLAYSSYY